MKGLLIFCFVFVKCNAFFFGPDNTMDEMLTEWGYPHETHTATTKDNYVLTVHRIQGRSSGERGKTGPPVFMMHGLLCSSVDWIVLGPGRSLGLILADAGYDVWLGNNRGNTFSGKEVNAVQNIASFYNYSYHEIGVYDLPAMIDLVISETGKDKLSYVGFSEGFTSFTVMGSKKPEYNDKILIMNGLAPVTDMYEAKILPFRVVARMLDIVEEASHSLGLHVILTHTWVLTKVSRIFCNEKMYLGKQVCHFLFRLLGASTLQLNKSNLTRIVSNFPAGMSIKQLLHYAQGVKTGVFCEYDYGTSTNLRHYGSVRPPVYNLSLVTSPIHIYYGEDDYYVNNVVLLNQVAKTLSNVKEVYKVPFPMFNHLDFIWGSNTTELNRHVLENINKANDMSRSVEIL